jgi:hypothetical protein
LANKTVTIFLEQPEEADYRGDETFVFLVEGRRETIQIKKTKVLKSNLDPTGYFLRIK